jgi:ligand-binding sensor domain-containing protein/two-component sensor histidine kinase
MRIYSLIVVFLFILFSSKSSLAQQHTFINYASEEGLPQSQVNSIVQDSSGFLWIATIGGLSRFDGKEFVNYSTLNGLHQNEISELAIDNDNQLWALGNLGLTRFNSNTFTNYSFDQKQRNVSKILVDNDTLWFASRNILIKFFNDSLHYIETGLEINNRIREIQRDEEGNLWLFASEAAYNFTSPEFPSDSLSIPYCVRIIKSGNETYISTIYDGIHRGFDTQNKVMEDLDGEGLYISDFAIEKNQKTFWIATDENLIKWSKGSYTEIGERNGLDYTNITTLFIDRENVLWIGTDGSGLYKYLGDLITTYTSKDGLTSEIIMGVSKRNDLLYTINYGGELNVIQPDTILDYPFFESVFKGKGWGLAGDDNNLYAAYNYGLGTINKNENLFISSDANFNGNSILSLYKDEMQDALLVGTRDGFVQIRNGEFDYYDGENGFPIGAVYSFLKETDGSLWVAGANGLFQIKDGELYKTYTKENGLSSNGIYSVALYNDRLWIGTAEGVFYKEGEDFVRFNFSNSPNDLTITCLFNDGLGRLWIGTSNGVSSIEQSLSGEVEIDRYGLQNGLRSLAINMNSWFVDDNGNVFFGSEKGLIRFDREKLEIQNRLPFPKVNLTNLQLYLKDIDWKLHGDSLVNGHALPINLELQPKENYLTFYFSGINTRNPNDVKYRFMLLGADGELSENWTNATKNNFATFSNLSSGTYTFKVQASTNPNKWGTEFTAYSFLIKTPYYATWWFRTLGVLLFASILFLIYRARIRRLRQEQDNLFLRSQSKMLALEQQTLNANMNRHFVFNALNSIQYYLNKEDKKSANRYLSRFAKLIRKNLDSSQSKQTTLSEEIERMILYMELEQMRFAHKFEFHFDVDPDINTRLINIPSMLFQPYLENSIWHGILPMETKGQIDVSIRRADENSISIVIFDNGIGIDTSMKLKDEKPKDHISVGMEITKNRLALYKQLSQSNASVTGPFEVQKDGKTIGTKVELTLPMLTQE